MKKKRFLVYFYLGFNSSVAIRTHPNIESHKFSPFLFFLSQGGGTIDIGCGNDFGGGEEEAADEAVELVNNVVDEQLGFDLHEIPMGKKDIKEYLQQYCKNLRAKLKEDDKVTGPEVKAFTQSAGDFCKWILSRYDDMEFYTSSSMDPDGSMAFAYYEDVNPIFVFIKAGLIEEKC
jgi:hypothetical protein